MASIAEPQGPTTATRGRAGEGLPAGWRVVARKELADHLLSLRFAVLLVLLGLAAVGAVYAAAGGIRDAAAQTSGIPALFLLLFTAAPERIPPFYVLIGFLAPLLGIAFGFDAINGERSQGTLPRLLAQPLHRDDVINGKFVAGLTVIALILGVFTLVVAGVGMLRLGIVPTPAEVARILVYLVVSIVYVGFWLALANLCSVALRRAATSALVAIAAWLVLTLFATLLVGLVADALAPVPADATPGELVRSVTLQQNLARLSPNALYQEATAVLLNPRARAVGFLLPVQVDQAVPSRLDLGQSLLLVWPQIVALVAVTVVLFAASYVLFLRQEIRA